MEINLNEVHTYLSCPLKYQLQNIDKIKVTPPKAVLYKQAVHKTIYFFFFSAMNGFIPTLAQMKDKWANVWAETMQDTPSPIEDILSVRASTRDRNAGRSFAKAPEDKLKIAGLEMIYNFYSFNKGNPGNIIAVDLDYRVPIGGLTINGKFELIREIVDAQDGKRYIEIVDFKTTDDAVDPFLVKNDFNLTVASYAFRNLFQGKEDRVKYHYMKTGRDIIITKNDNDFNRMKAVMNGVADSIEGDHFYPRQTFMCKTCEMKDVCDRVRF